jgi:SET domain-containing protein
MYLVKTYLDRSSIEGVGVFAGEDIPEGMVVWDLVEGFDQVLDPADVQKLPEKAQQYIKKYAYLARGKLYLCSDHGQFTNHSDAPNVISAPDGSEKEIAARDIKKGEELTSDYREFDEESRGKLVFEQTA